LRQQLDDTRQLQERIFRLAAHNSQLGDELTTVQATARDLSFVNKALKSELTGRSVPGTQIVVVVVVVVVVAVVVVTGAFF
jgi:hypothetical protein